MSVHGPPPPDTLLSPLCLLTHPTETRCAPGWPCAPGTERNRVSVRLRAGCAHLRCSGPRAARLGLARTRAPAPLTPREGPCGLESAPPPRQGGALRTPGGAELWGPRAGGARARAGVPPLPIICEHLVRAPRQGRQDPREGARERRLARAQKVCVCHGRDNVISRKKRG